jgi:dihydrofolate reductase
MTEASDAGRARPPIILYAAASLDGCIAETGGGIAWLDKHHSRDFDFQAFVDRVDVTVMGRTTLDHVKPFGLESLSGMNNFILTSRPLGDVPDYVSACAGPIPELARKLRSEARKGVWLMGGGETARQFIDAGEVDEMILFSLPVVLGAGVPLFPPGARTADVVLKDHRAFSNGAVMNVYGFA